MLRQSQIVSAEATDIPKEAKKRGKKKAVEEQADRQMSDAEGDIVLIGYRGFIFKIIAVMALN